EHRPVKPAIARLLPEHRMRDPVGGSPVPILVAPETAGLISASGHELEIVPVGHFVPINSKCGDVHRVGFVLIVPTEVVGATAEAECRHTRRDLNHPGDHRSAVEILWIS